MSEVGKSRVDLLNEVDVTTRARVANLSARGMTDYQIADILYLTKDHIDAVKDSPEFIEKYRAEADRIIQEQVDRDEGWDGLETAVLEKLLQQVRFNNDLKFLLSAGAVANRAERRAKNNKSDKPEVIDASKQAQGAKIIVLNRTYINNAAGAGMIDVTPKPKEIPLKQSDVPSPKLVDEFLAGAHKGIDVPRVSKEEEELERMFKEAGVVFDGKSGGI